jgi:NAD(P)-dependent dehydrogenase (short-subunit alcohol dehydrogenase family)
MDLGLAGKTALVTGGSAGIGFACARTLAEEGADVAIVAREPDRLERAAGELGATGRRIVAIAADLSLAADVTRAAAEGQAALGRIDILINNAGSAMGGPFVDLDDEAYRRAWDLKLLGYIRMTRAVVPAMIARRDGRIVNIIGGAGRTPNAEFLPGSTANAALINFTRGLSKELAKHNVRINAISPGTTATERQERLVEQRKRPGVSLAEAMIEAAAAVPLGRMVRPEEIAAMAAFLASDRSASTTGTEVQIDGGGTPGI